MRLDKFLCDTAGLTRTEAKNAIKKGQVAVNGQVQKTADFKVKENGDTVTFQGKPLSYAAFHYYMLHKPAGVITATEDKKESTVMDILKEEKVKNLFPVGRLDKDTEGLLLITDDGELAHNLLSPKKHVDKEYFVRTEGALTPEDSAAFAAGMTLGDGLVCQPAELRILSAGAVSEARVTLREGKFHQIKRMLACRGKPVLYLERIRMGNLTLDPALSRGEYRFLTETECKILLENGGNTGNARNFNKKP